MKRSIVFLLYINLTLVSCTSLNNLFIDGPQYYSSNESVITNNAIKKEKQNNTQDGLTLQQFILEANVETPFDLNAKIYEGYADEQVYAWHNDFTFYREEYYKVNNLIEKEEDYVFSELLSTSLSNYYHDIKWQWNCAVLSYVMPVYQEFKEKKAQKKEEEWNNKNTFDRNDFYYISDGFQPSIYEQIDLLKGVANGQKMEVHTVYFNYAPLYVGYEPLYYVSDAVFVRQQGTNVTFKTHDSIIQQNMIVDSKIELNGGETVTIFYVIENPFEYYVVAIKKDKTNDTNN